MSNEIEIGKGFDGEDIGHLESGESTDNVWDI